MVIRGSLFTILCMGLFIGGIALSASSKAQSANEQLVNEWTLEAIQEFGAKYEPKEKQQEDELTLEKENKFSGTWNGQSLEGEWQLTGNDQWLILKPENESQLKCKMIHSSSDSLVVEHQNKETLVRTKYIYEPQ